MLRYKGIIQNRNGMFRFYFYISHIKLPRRGGRESMKMKSGRAASVPAGLGMSLMATIIITASATALIAIMLSRKTIEWANIGYWIMTVLLLASFLGGKVAINAIKTQKYLVSLMSGILYWMFLLCITALLFGGHYNSVLETGLLIVAGSTAAALLQFPQRVHRMQTKHRSYR